MSLPEAGIPGRTSGRAAYLAAAIACVIGSALLIWAAVTGAPGLRVPPLVAVGLAAVLILAAWRLQQLHGGDTSAGDGAAALMLAGMAGFCLWVAVGPGTRSCGVGFGGRSLADVGDLACRVPFGFGGALVALAALYAGRRWWRARRAFNSSPA